MRDLAKAGELAAAELVEDLAGLLLGELVDLRALIPGEQAQRAAREVRIPRERLVGADEPVAAERHRVPGDARGREGPGLGEFDERAQVERAAGDEPFVERLRARRIEGAAAQEAAVAGVERVQRVVEAGRRRGDRRAVLAREDRELDREDALRGELSLHHEDVPVDRVGRGPHGHLGHAPHTVTPQPLEDERVAPLRPLDRRVDALPALIAADGEHVLERRLEFELDAHLRRPRLRVLDPDALP